MIKKLRYCFPAGTDPYENLATEYALMHAAEPCECIMSLWRNRKTVVIGRNQNIFRECRVEELQADSGTVARRMSGGGAVFHDLGNLNFSFLARDKDYDVDHQLSVIITALKEFGINALKTGRNDITVGGRKISGNAFLREGNARCHHGTLLINVSAEDMTRYLIPDREKLLSKGVSSVPSRVVNLHELNENITAETLTKALVSAFSNVYGITAEPFPLEELDSSLLEKQKEKLSSDEWIYGKNPSFTFKSSRVRFPWGSGELCFDSAHGKITDAVFYTDAMDETISKRISEKLNGMPCRKDELLSAVRSGDWPYEISDALSQLICEVF